MPPPSSSEHRGSQREPRSRGSRSSWARAAWIAVPLVLAAGTIWLAQLQMFAGADLLLQRFLFRAGPPPADAGITIIAIDDASIASVGQYPWPRERYADLLTALAPMRPMAVAFDVGFFDETAEDPAPLVDAINAFPGPVILATKAVALTPSTTPGLLRAETLGLPIPALRDSKALLAFANVLVDRDNAVRRVPARIDGGEAGILESLAVQTLRSAYGADGARDPVTTTSSGLQLTSRVYQHLGTTPRRLPIRTIPLDAEGAFLVNYLGDATSFPVVPFHAVLDGTADAALLRDRILLVGATALDLHDVVSRPGISVQQVPGVAVHAHAIATIASGDMLFPESPWATRGLVVLYAALAAVIAWALRSVRSILAGLVLIASIPVVAAIGFSTYAFGDRPGALLSLIYPLIAAVGSYIGVLLVRVATEEREKGALRRAFTQYVSPEVVRSIAADPSKLKLGGQRRMLTVLFSDLRGFTSISERLDAEELVLLLNEYFTIQTQLVLDRAGVIDKFIGDALMAFWGAPMDDPEQEVHACGAALAMVRSIPAFNASIAARGLPPIAMGVGVNTGPAVVGNMGSAKRFDYTAMGDTVNLASRLEGLTKAYGVSVLVTDHTRRGAGAALHFRTIDRVKVKGKQQSVTIAEIVGLASEGPIPAWVAPYEAALQHAWKRAWDQAADGFHRVLALKPDDGPAQLFLERIDHWRAVPPPPDWDGSSAFDHK